MAGNEHTAGVSIGLDASEFLGGSAKAQDEIERLVASFIHASREGDKTVASLAKSLSASPKEVTKALREMDKQDAEAGRIVARRQASAQKAARDRHRIEMRMLKERGQAVSNLRDSLLSLAAISIGGGAGLAGAYNAVKGTAQEGADEGAFAHRTGTNFRQNVAEEEGARLSGVSNAGEARSSIANWATAREDYRLKGEQSGLYKTLLGTGVDLEKFVHIKNHAEAIQFAVSSLRKNPGWTDADVATVLERAGLTSGGYTDFALNSRLFREKNRLGYQRTSDMNEGADRKAMADLANMESLVSHLQRTVARDLEPVVGDISNLVIKIDEIAQKNPDFVRQAAEFAAGATALGGAIMALMPVFKAVSLFARSPLALALGIGKATAHDVQTNGVSPFDTGAGQLYADQVKNAAAPISAKDSGISDEQAKAHYLQRTGDWKYDPQLLFANWDAERGVIKREQLADRLTGAVAMQESGGNPNIVNPRTGAAGLMQFMPATARENGVSNPFDAQQAWRGGRNYLMRLLDHYNGDVGKALAAYNWGMGNVDKDVSAHGAGWSSFLPHETSDYLMKVNNNLRTGHVVRSPGAAAATRRPLATLPSPSANHAAGNTTVHMQVSGVTVRANNAQEFQKSMVNMSHERLNLKPTSWNRGQM